MNGTHLGSESAVQGEGREIQQLLHPVKVAAHTLYISHTYASVNFQLSKQLICAKMVSWGVTSLLEGKSQGLQSG